MNFFANKSVKLVKIGVWFYIVPRWSNFTVDGVTYRSILEGKEK